MNIFYDFEFLEDGQIIEPISLGMVHSDRDAELYIINIDFPDDAWTEWLTDNVKPHLRTLQPKKSTILELHKKDIGAAVYDWLYGFDEGTNWKLIANYADYDHVCLAQLFGRMIDLPEPMPWWSRDLKQWFDDLGNPKAPFREEMEHNALADARHNANLYKWLTDNYQHPAWSVL